MPPYQNASHDHAPSSSSSQNPVANSQRSSVASTTSYTSLGHALAPAASRGSDSHHHRQPTPKNSRAPPQMASEGRYMYHPQEVPPAPPYPYAYPPAPPYENGQYAQSSSRAPARSPPPPQPVSHPPPQQPVSHPPPPAPYNGAHPPYPPQPGYPPPAYGVPPQQWSGEWSHYNTSYPPTAPPGQSPYPPPAVPGARPDLSPNTPHDDRRYAQPPSRQEPQSRRTEERPPQRPEAAPPPPAPVRKTRENEHSAQGHAPPPPAPVAAQAPAPPPPPQSAPSAPPVVSTSAVGIDFVKLLESYRVIIDSTNAIAYETTPTRPPPPAETLERMLQAATYGAQVLDAAAKRAVPEPPRPPADRSQDERDGDANRGRQQEGENQAPTEGQTCLGCAATSTPEWRRGPMGPRTLCNACGLVYAKLIKKRNRNEPGRGRGGGQPARSTGQIVSGPVDEPGIPGQDDPSDSDSDDDGSYGSQQDGRYRRD